MMATYSHTNLGFENGGTQPIPVILSRSRNISSADGGEARPYWFPPGMRERPCAAEQNSATACSRLFLSRHAVDFSTLQQSEKEYAMNKSSPVSLAPLAALLLAGSALAQTIPSPNPSGVDADRVDRRCTSATLTTDASAPCSDDVLNDGPRVLPVVVRAPGNSTAGSGNTSAGTTTQPSPSSTGTASTGTTGNTGAGSTGASMGTTGMPSTGTVNSGTSSIPGATGTGAVSASGAARTPARR
jgi:hypothetical protein